MASDAEGDVPAGVGGQRRAKDGVRRTRRVVVRFSEAEYDQVVANAGSEHPPKALACWIAEVAAAPKNPRRSRPQRVRADLLVVLMDLRRQVVGAATNVNQMARVANATGQINPAVPGLLERLQVTARGIDEAIRVLVADGR